MTDAILRDYQKMLQSLIYVYPKMDSKEQELAAANELLGVLTVAESELQHLLLKLEVDTEMEINEIESELRGDGIEDNSLKEDLLKEINTLQNQVEVAQRILKRLKYQEHVVKGTRPGGDTLVVDRDSDS